MLEKTSNIGILHQVATPLVQSKGVGIGFGTTHYIVGRQMRLIVIEDVDENKTREIRRRKHVARDVIGIRDRLEIVVGWEAMKEG